MDRKETYEILNMLKAAYPLFYSNTHSEFMDKVISVWQENLNQYDFELVKQSVGNMIVTETQIPTIALVRTYIVKQIEQDEKERKKANAWKEAGCASEEEFREKIAELRR